MGGGWHRIVCVQEAARPEGRGEHGVGPDHRIADLFDEGVHAGLRVESLGSLGFRVSGARTPFQPQLVPSQTPSSNHASPAPTHSEQQVRQCWGCLGRVNTCGFK